jgi:FkbM family methyltransferase
MIQRILQRLQQVRNGRRFGVPFLRHSRFQVPAQVKLGQRTIELSYPDEVGVWNDFLVCFIHDEYGLGRLPSSVATIVDIGANVGFFSLAARGRFPEAMIHAYEPNSRTLAYLQKNAAAGRFDVFGEAVGATEGWVTIEDAGDSNQARTSASADAQGVRQVPFATIVERIGGWIDFAKIDCEGAEWDLFRDTASWKRIGEVRMEYHLVDGHSYADVERSLSGLGFDIYLHHPAESWGMVWARNRSPAAR